MKDNIKIFGYSKDNRTYYKLKFDQIEETDVNSVSGKAVFDFLWIDGNDFGTIFTNILSAFASGGVGEAISTAAPFVDKNSYLTIYIAAFIDYLAENTAILQYPLVLSCKNTTFLPNGGGKIPKS